MVFESFESFCEMRVGLEFSVLFWRLLIVFCCVFRFFLNVDKVLCSWFGLNFFKSLEWVFSVLLSNFVFCMSDIMFFWIVFKFIFNKVDCNLLILEFIMDICFLIFFFDFWIFFLRVWSFCLKLVIFWLFFFMVVFSEFILFWIFWIDWGRCWRLFRVIVCLFSSCFCDDCFDVSVVMMFIWCVSCICREMFVFIIFLFRNL